VGGLEEREKAYDAMKCKIKGAFESQILRVKTAERIFFLFNGYCGCIFLVTEAFAK
jgi:hypothetical protein